MKYVKVYDSSGQIMDALSSLHFVYWNTISNMIDDCAGTDSRRMGLLSYDASTIWHLSGKPDFPQQYGFVTCQYTEIDKDEFEILRKALDEKTDDEIPDDISPDISPVTPDDDEYAVNLVKTSKIAEMSHTCEAVLTNGIDIVLSDNNTYHFSLTTQDQLNLITLSTMIAGGQEMVPYHADSELCRYYSATDMLNVIQKATEFKSFQVTYFNSLRAYIESMNSVRAIGAVQYGIDIPEEYQSDVLKEMLKQMNEQENENNPE